MTSTPRASQLAHTTGLILSGGGARAAYQVGVLKAIAEILPNDAHNPFGIICGTSAGAINAAGMAMGAAHFRRAVEKIAYVWSNFSAHQVYRTDAWGASICAGKWLSSLVLGGRLNASVLDNSPLVELIDELIEFSRIQQAINNGDLKALCVTASGYTSGKSVSFFQGRNNYDAWRRHRRFGMKTAIRKEHLLASAAIPTIFPAVRINREFFGDGAVRQLAPISPALHLGADRVMVIGVSGNLEGEEKVSKATSFPSTAQILGHVLNSAFLDALEGDMERLIRVNNTLTSIPKSIRDEAGISLRPVGVLTVSPSQCLRTIAAKHAAELPNTIRLFLRTGGKTDASGSTILSYLLFTRGYCSELIELGYQDAIGRANEIAQFILNEEILFDKEGSVILAPNTTATTNTPKAASQ